MNKASLEQWLQQLDCLHPEEIELGLDRVAAVAHNLALLPLTQPVVTVAGTNGKGSTVAVLEALLKETGRSTGVFTSPHFLRFNERICVDGTEVADGDIISAFAAIEDARGDVSLTYFEFATLAALLVFKASQPDVVILEVGLGGRLDSVNIVDPTVAVITSIDLDHQAWLGDSRGEIAREKAGILREATPVVIAEEAPPPELMACVSETAAYPVLCLGRDFFVNTTGEGWQGVLCKAGEVQRVIPEQLYGALLPSNICAALQAALLLGVDFSDEQILSALAKVAPVGRRQVQQLAGRSYVLDVAHNPAAVDKLLENISITPCKGKNIALFSAMSDKNIRAMITATTGFFDAWFLADQPANTRAVAASDVADLLYEQGQNMISVSKNLRQAFRRAQGLMEEGDRLVVFGSFYTVAAVLPLLDRDRSKGGL
jgi:dihydrofolate synthase/folylpolyglutamate synthase